MLAKAEALQEAGFDIMGITPTWMGPEFRNNEALANSLWKDLIKNVRGKFKGKIAVILNAEAFLSDIDAKAEENGVNVSVMFSPFSYEASASLGILEFYDILDPKTSRTKADYYHQADQHQAFLEGLEGKGKIERVVVGSFWWDDALDPLVPAKISVSPSPRNKPSEELIGKWFLAK